MAAKDNYCILVWFVMLGALSCVALTDWGSPASIATVVITGVTSLVLLSKWSYSKWTRDRPFRNVWYVLQNDSDGRPKVGTSPTACQEHISSNKANLRSQKDKMKVTPGKYHLYLELSPRMSFKISDVDFRFWGDTEYRPTVLEVHDTSWRRLYSSFDCGDDGDLGIECHYDPLTIVHRGKDLYYIASFDAKGAWDGEFSLAFYMENRGIHAVRIRCTVESLGGLGN